MRPMGLSLTVVAIAVAAAGGYWAGSGGHGTPAAGTEVAATGEAAPAQGSGERKILYYRNPMGLPDTSPVPKKDSMGMDYIPVYEGDGPDDSGAVKVSPARLQTLGVKTARAETAVVDAAVRAVGRVEVDERRIHDVAPRFEGWIERLFVSATGDPVKKGQALFSVYSPELVSAQQELQIAERLSTGASAGEAEAVAGAERLAQAARERLRNWNVAPGKGDAARVTLSSPANGVVLEKRAVEGMRFAPGTAIYRIADLSSVWVLADVYEQDLARVRVGEAAQVTLDAYPGRSFDARVAYLYPTLNAATRTTTVRLELPNPDGLLRPGMFAHAELATADRIPQVTVPRSAVIDSGERQVVFVVQGVGRFKPQAVKLGQRGSERVEILDGLAEGDEVVVAANFLIDAESNLKAALASFAEPEAAAAKVYEATGNIESIDLSSNSVSMTHDPIPDLQWPAMTMDFGLDNAEVTAGVLPGEPIWFAFEDRGDGEFVITRIEKMDGANAAGHGGH
jgi:Cu(I)/Ag(I) efflux system membrane fusion protein